MPSNWIASLLDIWRHCNERILVPLYDTLLATSGNERVQVHLCRVDNRVPVCIKPETNNTFHSQRVCWILSVDN